MKKPSTITYSLLGLLCVRSWTGYELTQQVQRSLRFTWPTSEGHLYREQRLLVDLGWATVETESVGRRTRKRYTVTDAGREAFREWLGTEPQRPSLEIEAVSRLFFSDQGTPEDLGASLRTTATQARADIASLQGFIEEYLTTGGAFPDRAHLIALTADLITDLLGRIESFSLSAADEVEGWETTRGLGMTEATRERMERILER